MSNRQLLKTTLKRGALVAAANWPVTLVQATADALFKLLFIVPIVGGIFLVALVLGTEPDALISMDWREMALTTVAVESEGRMIFQKISQLEAPSIAAAS